MLKVRIINIHHKNAKTYIQILDYVSYRNITALEPRTFPYIYIYIHTYTLVHSFVPSYSTLGERHIPLISTSTRGGGTGSLPPYLCVCVYDRILLKNLTAGTDTMVGMPLQKCSLPIQTHFPYGTTTSKATFESMPSVWTNDKSRVTICELARTHMLWIKVSQ